MRLLHTSDWHLGANLEAVSRHLEQSSFLTWLLGIIEDRQVDVLVVAGDVFDGTQPPADAQRLYFSFLARLARTRLAAAVIVGGNHDSAARLDAPAEVLSALAVHVVGGYRVQDPLERLLCPLRDRQGRLLGVVAAVPFVHEVRLGVSVTAGDTAEVKARFEAKLTELYRSLADLAVERYGPVPLIATGHLAVGTPQRADYPLEIHQIGTLGAVSPELFDPRYRYVALGHIHRSYPASADRRVWYSGAPVAISFAEAAFLRRVLLVELDEEPVAPVAIEVPCQRRLCTVSGSLATLHAALGSLTWTEPEPPLCAVTLEQDPERGESHDPRALTELQAWLGRRFAGIARPELVAFRQVVRRSPTAGADDAPARSLRDLEPLAVFRELCAARGVPLTLRLLACFDQVLGDARDGAAAEREPRQAVAP